MHSVDRPRPALSRTRLPGEIVGHQAPHREEVGTCSMDPEQELEQESRPPLVTYEDLGGRIDHMLVRPDLSNDEIFAGLELAKRYRVASATVRPCDIDLAVRTLQGSSVRPASVAGFPHGSQNTGAKL